MDSEQRLKEIQDAIKRTSNISIKELFDKGSDIENYYQQQLQSKKSPMCDKGKKTMVIKGIDERIKTSAERVYASTADKYCYSVGYYNGAIEQDSIARQEERERCINAAIKAHCSFCPNYLFDCSLCNEKEIIRKTIEEGGNI